MTLRPAAVQSIREKNPPTDPEPFEELGRQAAAKGAVCAAMVIHFPDGSYEVLAYPPWLAIKNDLIDAGKTIMVSVSGKGEEEE
jgi:hypothetical protein